MVLDHGMQLVDLEWRELRPRGPLRLYVDKPGGVGIADCERLSRELGDVLDAAALIEGGLWISRSHRRGSTASFGRTGSIGGRSAGRYGAGWREARKCAAG